jgi:hypothetical protein
MIVPDKHCALPSLVQGSVAAAFTAGAGLRATRPLIYYAASFERISTPIIPLDGAVKCVLAYSSYCHACVTLPV